MAKKENSLESKIERLEQLAEKIKSVDLPLEEALGVFEEGIKLSRSVEKDIDKIEGRIEVLTNGPDVETADAAKFSLFEGE